MTEPMLTREMLNEIGRDNIGHQPGWIRDAIIAAAMRDIDEAVARWTLIGDAAPQALPLLIQGMMEPTKEIIDAGETVLEDHRDSDWDSGPDGEGCNSYDIIRPGAARAIHLAMLRAYARSLGLKLEG